jgi:lactate racemase
MKLAYGHSYLEFSPPDGVSWRLLEPEVPTKTVTVSLSAVVADLLHQLDERGLPLRQRLLLIIPDHTRRCRIDEILQTLLPALEQRFDPQIEILIANGSHALQPEETIRDLVGADIYRDYTVVQHDSHDGAALYYWGQTGMGTPVYLNRRVKEAHFIITIGGTLFHYFAGYGGGPKMLVPGVAGYETIRLNHQRTIDPFTAAFHQECREGNLTNNPVFRDLAEVGRAFDNLLSIQVVLNPLKEFVFAEAGALFEVHEHACAQVNESYRLAIKQKADVVVASAGGFPSDVNLIQSHKSLHHAFQAVKENGFIILLAECREGVGSKTCMPVFDAGDSQAMGRQLLENYQINGQTALAMRMKAEKAGIYLVSTLPPELVAKTGLTAADSVAGAWREIQSRIATHAFGYIMPKASIYMPVLVP